MPRSVSFILAIAGLATWAFEGSSLAQEKREAPTSRPRIKTHQGMLEKVRERPLAKVEPVREDGSSLTAAEKKELERAQKLFDEAVAARKKGDYEAAQGPVRECKKIRVAILGNGQHPTVSVLGLERTISRVLNSPADQRLELVEADKQQAKAEEEFEAGNYPEAIAFAKRALAVQERLLGRNNHELGHTLRIMGAAQTELVALSDAEVSLSRAEDIMEKSYGKAHPYLAKVLDRKGWLKFSRGDSQAAVEALTAAVRIYLHTVGDTLETAEAIDNLGTAQAVAGDAGTGLQNKLRALVIRQTLAGPEGKETGVSYSNLAWMYNMLEMDEEVIPLRKRALEIFEKTLGPDHPYTNTEAVNLGMACQEKGMLKEALKLYERTVQRDDEKPLKTLSPHASGRATRLGLVCLEMGRFKEGDEALKRAIARARAIHEAGNDAAAADQLHHVAIAFNHYRMWDDALRVYEEAISWDAREPAPTEKKINRLEQLGSIYLAVDRPADAKKLLIKAAAQSESMFGKGEQRTAGSLLGLAQTYEKLGELEEAEKMAEQVLKISETKVGPGTKPNAFALRAIGRIYLKRKKLDLAKFSLEDAYRIIEPNQDIDPIEMIRIQLDRSELFTAMNDKAEAAKAIRDALDRAKKVQSKFNSPHVRALTASAIKKLLECGEGVSSAEQEALRSELKSTLEGMAATRALNAEEKGWLRELGGGASAKR